MTSRAVPVGKRKGRPPGGLFAFGLAVLAGCLGGGPRSAEAPRAEAVSRPLQTYRQLGLLVGPSEFPAVISLSTVAGPADSAYVLLAMSLPNGALRFQRDATGFRADYEVSAEFRRAGETVRRFGRRESVHVASFAETGRTDESVVFQQAVLLAAGAYEMVLRAASGGGRGLDVVDSLVVPAYLGPEARLAGPLLIYDGTGRHTREALPDLILNPRHTIPFGGEPATIYVEWYGPGDAIPLHVRLLAEPGDTVACLEARIDSGAADVRHQRIELPLDPLPLGRLWIEVGTEGVSARAPLIVSISDQWLVANFDDVLQFLRYIATAREISELSEGSAQERRRRWDRFWARRDPLPATPNNEFRDEFFQRVRYATEQFAEAGMPGWRTHRGEVYIVLGAPDVEQDRSVGRAEAGRPNAIEWHYENVAGGRVSLVFFDRTGFGRFELTPSSEASFRSVAERLRPRSDGDRTRGRSPRVAAGREENR